MGEAYFLGREEGFFSKVQYETNLINKKLETEVSV